MNGRNVSIGLFYCPQCEQTKSLPIANKYRQKYCSTECYMASGDAKVTAKYYDRKLKRKCDRCGRGGNYENIVRFKKENLCGPCINGPIAPPILEDYVYAESNASRMQE